MPYFDPDELDYDAEDRLDALDRLRDFFLPTDQHVTIYRTVYRQIRNGYRLRHPFTAEGQKLLYQSHDPQIFERSLRSNPLGLPSTISFIVGLSGVGKTQLFRQILSTFRYAAFQHSRYKNRAFTEFQILYLVAPVPENASINAMCRDLGLHANSLVPGGPYERTFTNPRLKSDNYRSELATVCANHHVGILGIDELQNAKGNRNRLITFLINMRTHLKIPIILIGTPKAIELIADSFSIQRRATEGGFFYLSRIMKPSSTAWKSLTEVTWNYQWVRNKQELSTEISNTLHDFSQGITGIMLTLFIKAQEMAIDSGIEKVDVNLLREAYYERLEPLHEAVEALRSGSPKKISRFDDLYQKAYRQVAGEAESRYKQIAVKTKSVENRKRKTKKKPNPKKLSDDELRNGVLAP